MCHQFLPYPGWGMPFWKELASPGLTHASTERGRNKNKFSLKCIETWETGKWQRGFFSFFCNKFLLILALFLLKIAMQSLSEFKSSKGIRLFYFEMSSCEDICKWEDPVILAEWLWGRMEKRGRLWGHRKGE